MSNAQFRQGTRTESSFTQMATQRGWEPRIATFQQNVHQHIDCFLSKNATTHAIDVKGMKAIERTNAVVQDAWHVVEFIAVTYPRSHDSSFSLPFDIGQPDFSRGSGRPGWLYGKANYIAFETRRHWLFVRPLDLIELCHAVVDSSSLSPSSRDAKYQLYSRPQRGDLFSFIHIDDITTITNHHWHKK